MSYDYYVYMLSAVKHGKPVAPVKVGITKNLRSRMRTISTSCPFEIKLVHALNLPTEEIARQVEGCFHYCYGSVRLKGEWFEIEPYEALAWLSLQFITMLELKGAPEELHDLIIERSGAGLASLRVLETLRTAEH